MPTEPSPLTLADALRRAVEVCDPDDTDADLGDLLARFEDADEPITAVEDLEGRLAEAVESIGPEEDLPQLVMATAVVSYLARRRDELHADPLRLLTLAARAEFDGEPPPAVADWLRAQGVSLSAR